MGIAHTDSKPQVVLTEPQYLLDLTLKKLQELQMNAW